jgi:ribokinase
MIGQVGDDGFGQTLRDGLAADGIDVSGIRQTSATTTGVAMILVEDIGQNRIVLAAGANGALTPADIDAVAATIAGAAMLVVQLEIPMPVVQRAIAIARSAGVTVLLNPAPAAPLPDDLWSQLDILVPNESEASLLAGVPVVDVASAYAAARIFRQRGAGCVLITLGKQGVAVLDDAGERHFPAHVVAAVDTTAAGDTFIGGLAAGLVEGMSLDAAVDVGQRASALCVTRHGAQPSIPYRRELSAA